jgi:FAD binding domain
MSFEIMMSSRHKSVCTFVEKRKCAELVARSEKIPCSTKQNFMSPWSKMQPHRLVTTVRCQRVARLHRIIFYEKTNRCSIPAMDTSFRTFATRAGAKEDPGTLNCSTPRSEPSNQVSVTRIASIMAACGVAFSLGYQMGRQSSGHRCDAKPLVLPNGLPRTCCNSDNSDKSDHPHQNQTPLQSHLPKKLQRIVGKENVLDGMVYNTETMPFLKGARLGMGQALCIVTPRHLHHVVSVVEACVEADCIILPQGQNTGLTGGSVPHQTDASRPVVLLSFKHLDSIFPIDDGERVVCMAGVGLASVGYSNAAFYWIRYRLYFRIDNLVSLPDTFSLIVYLFLLP